MKYNNIIEGRFIERPNRFIARVDMGGKQETVHVKNTGKCKEILVPGAVVYLERCINQNRKTEYDLVAARKGDRVINIDSQLPNNLVEEWLDSQDVFSNITLVKREKTYGNSRFDFYLETVDRKIYMEVKGCTREIDGVASFPDAPTERGIKHICELVKAVEMGFEAYLFFVIQLNQVRFFTPAVDIHPAFAKTLQYAVKKGVKLLAYDCVVQPDEVRICDPVSIKLRNVIPKLNG